MNRRRGAHPMTTSSIVALAYARLHPRDGSRLVIVTRNTLVPSSTRFRLRVVRFRLSEYWGNDFRAAVRT
jgi:hypothetical protein